MKFVYGNDPNDTLSFESEYLVKIIDYGRVFLRKHTNMFRNTMYKHKVRNINAFSFLINREKEKNYSTSPFRYITSYKRNKSYDLKSIVDVREFYKHRIGLKNTTNENMLEQKKIFLNKVQYNLAQDKVYGTPELKDSKDKKKHNGGTTRKIHYYHSSQKPTRRLIN